MTTEAEEFDIAATWPDGIDAVEQDVADIRLRVNGQLLTRVVDTVNDITRDGIRASAVSLAFFLADHWWRLRYEPYPEALVPSPEWRSRHELTAVSGGVRWPPLMIYGSGKRIVLAPRAGIADVPGPVRYINLLVTSVHAALYERKMDEFFERVRGRCTTALDAEALSVLLDDLHIERNDPERASWRRLEAQLGFDPGTVPDSLMDLFAKFEAELGETAVSEAAVSAPGQQSAETLKEVLLATKASDIHLDRNTARGILQGIDADRMAPWELAEIAARKLRVCVGMQQGPILGAALGDIVGAKWPKILAAEATAKRLPYGAVVPGNRDLDRVALRSSRGAQRRFDIARALGDAVWEAFATFAPVSDAKTDRQKFQRAFAGSLLCPYEELQGIIDATSVQAQDIRRAAKYFHVNEGVVRTILVNKRILPRETLADRLEAA